MNERRTKTVSVFVSGTGWDGSDDDGVPELLKDIPAWAEALLETVPPEYRDQVCIAVDDDGDWDSPSPQLHVWYEYLESEEEAAEREAETARGLREFRDRRTAEERALFERLKAKFESS